MLPRPIRHTREAFDRTFRTAKRKHLPFGQVLFVPARDLRISVVVGKKVESTAVGRNRFRRRLYSRLRALKTEGRTGNFILIANPAVKKATFDDVASSFLEGARSFLL